MCREPFISPQVQPSSHKQTNVSVTQTNKRTSMNNCEEFTLSEMRLALCHVKEVGRVIAHSILFARAIGGSRTLEPVFVKSASLDVDYVRCGDQYMANVIDSRLNSFAEVFERNGRGPVTAHLLIQFYMLRPRKQALWNVFLGNDEKVVFEQWRIPISIQHFRQQTNSGTEDMTEEDYLQRSASEQLSSALMKMSLSVAQKMDHLPQPPKDSACYNFDITYELPTSPTAWSPRSITESMRRIPYINS
jgi:hypothetical protein